MVADSINSNSDKVGNIYIITPHGGSNIDIITTMASVELVSKTYEHIQFHHYVVLNNGAFFLGDFQFDSLNATAHIIDLNPVASRALARNTALDLIADSPCGYVIFLDSGDKLLDSALTSFDKWTELNIFSAKIELESGESSIRKPEKINKKYFCNPFYLGAVYLKKELATSFSFNEGRKEDWKYWLDILKADVDVKYFPDLAYIYTIKNKRDHIKRKSKLIKDQFIFYKDYLKFNILKSTLYLLIHYSYLMYRWIFKY